MASEQGFSNQKKKGKAQFKTIHPVNSGGYGESVIPKYLADKSPGSNCAVDTITEILNNNGQVEFWEILFDQTVDAVAGDVIRFKGVSDPKLYNFEFDVVEAISSDTLRVLPISDAAPSVGDTIQLLRFVSAASDDSGNPQVSLVPAAIKFDLNGSLVDVHKDSVTPSSSIPLPVEDLAAQGSLASLDSRIAGSLVPVEHDEIVTTYVGATTDISTVVYKLAGSTVATLTLSYDGSNRLIGVVRS